MKPEIRYLLLARLLTEYQIILHISGVNGVSDGAWTRDIPDHNRVLYQLSYAHHVKKFGAGEV